MLMMKGKKRSVEAEELANMLSVNLAFLLLIDSFSMKTVQGNLIYISAHVCLSVASRGSLISCNWKDGFFKMSL